MAARQTIMVAFPHVQSLDVSGPMEVFAGAHKLLRHGARADRSYQVRLASRDGAPLLTSSGLTLVPQAALRALTGPIDTLIVAGGDGARAAAADRELVAWPRARRVASVQGRVRSRRRRPARRQAGDHALAGDGQLATFDSEPVAERVVVDGKLITAAGGSAGIDTEGQR